VVVTKQKWRKGEKSYNEVTKYKGNGKDIPKVGAGDKDM
jgi:hypothetical protein